MRGKQTVYEWCIETVSKDGDIVDHNHRDKLENYHVSELLEDEEGYTKRLVLVRDVFSYGDLVCRSWAYLTGPDRVLPTHFNDTSCDVAPVPKRFPLELTRWRANLRAKGAKT